MSWEGSSWKKGFGFSFEQIDYCSKLSIVVLFLSLQCHISSSTLAPIFG